MTQSATVGLTCVTARNTATYGSPVWNVISIVIDANLGLSKDMAEIKARVSTWKKNLPLLKGSEIKLKLLADPSVDDYDVLRDAFIADTVIEFAFADGTIATSGTEYMRLSCYVKDFPLDQPLEGESTVDCTLALAYSSVDPAWTTTGS